LIAAGSRSWWGDSGDCLLPLFHVGVEVDLDGAELFVAEPEPTDPTRVVGHWGVP
jgi:hypothetical protein